MRINSITNGYKQNFKASFADDNNTRNSIKEMAAISPCNTLAINFALKDIDSDEKLSVWTVQKYGYKEFAFENKSTGNSMWVGKSRIDAALLALCGWFSNVDGPLFTQKAKLNAIDYFEKARDIVENKTSNLMQQRKVLNKDIENKKKELCELTQKLDELDDKICEEKTKFVQDMIFDK